MQEDVQNITVLEGQSAHLQCIPAPDSLIVQWSFNTGILLESEEVILSPPILHHTLTITNAHIEDSGVYTCYVMNFQTLVSVNITLKVLPSKHKDTCILYMHVCLFMWSPL